MDRFRFRVLVAAVERKRSDAGGGREGDCSRLFDDISGDRPRSLLEGVNGADVLPVSERITLSFA